MPESKIPIGRRAIAHRVTRTAAQVDAHVQAHQTTTHKRLSSRPAVAPKVVHLDARIAKHGASIRMKRPEASGS